MKTTKIITLIQLLFCVEIYAQSEIAWYIKKPFEHHVFIENKGQFTSQDKKDIPQPIMYYNRLGKIQLYFSTSSITFRYDSISEIDNASQSKLKESDAQNLKAIPQFLTMSWLNANPDVEVEEPVTEYFTYGNPDDKLGHSGILAHAWKKLIYRNLYKGIDVEFTFPEDKGGLEYNFILHPGADISNVKMMYSGNVQISQHGNDISIASPCLNLIDHAPFATDENGNQVAVSFDINKNIVSFKVNGYDKTKTVTIDPWITSTNFFSYNFAYDVAYDNQGNIYIAGGQPPYELEQYNSSGKLIWTYNTVFAFGGPPIWYGGFTTDVRTGSCYMVKGLGNDALAKAVKVNNQGIQVAQIIQEINIELWRVAYDCINNQLVCGAGLNYQVALMDTALIALNDISLISGYQHDMSYLALDGQGNAFMATNLQVATYPTYNNVVFKLPLPSLSPIIDTFHDNYNLQELLSLYYYPAQSNGGYDYANGYNGMAANKSMLITYDGASVKKWNTSSGVLEDSVMVSKVSYQWGGIDLDCEGNIYLANDSTLSIYDSNLVLKSNMPLAGTTYALKLGNGQLYACGNGFVEAMPAPIQPTHATVTGVAPLFCSKCNGSATAYPGCGIPPFTYLWSNGSTLQTDTGLCIGTYSVTVTDASCPPRQDFVSLNLISPGNVFVPDAFSPNGDGQNDVLYVKGNCISSIDFMVYDRWGNKVFETTDMNNGWDGKYNGKAMNTGTYAYLLTAMTLTGNTITQHGNVALVR